jgi:4-amino-4-deoxy-L-arabinose transferase-like glycosyltransferase
MKIKNFISHNLFFLILFLAGFLRLWKLGEVPPHLTPDEASLGYNAFSILKTGRDEFGNFLPIVFQSFGDYKPGLYVYMTVPFISLFGLSEWVVRLPSAISGIVSVWIIYLIVKYLNNENKSDSVSWKIENFAALVAATNPWLIYFSRGAWEVNLALTLTLAGIYLFFRIFEAKVYLFYSGLFFSLTLLAYQGAKLSTLVVLIILTIVFYKELVFFIKGNIAYIIKILIVILVVVSPILLSFFRGQTGRLQVFSLFSYNRPTELVQGILNEGGEKINSLSYQLFHSETIYQKGTFLNHYFNHFSGRFLFFEGDWQNARHTSPNSGVMLIFDLVLLSIGLFILAGNKNHKFRNFVFLWLLLSPLPAVLSRDQVHAVRALNISVPLVLISSLGLMFLLQLLAGIKMSKLRIMSTGFLIFLFFGSFAYFIDSYFVHVRIHQSNEWYFGYREAAIKADELRLKHNVLFIQSYAQPYIYFMFYRAAYSPENFNPRDYQVDLKNNFAGGSIDVGLVKKLNNVTFAGFSWPAPGVTGDIVIGTPIDIPDFYANDRFKLIDEIKQPNGNTAFRIVEKL